MAMFEEFVLRTADLQDAFQKAAQAGNRYLLVLDHIMASEWMVTSGEYTRAVKEEKDIVPLLKHLNPRPDPDNKHNLSAVYDLSKSFNQQAGTRPGYKTALSPDGVRDIEQYEKYFDLSVRQAAWDKQSFLVKLFSTRPT